MIFEYMYLICLESILVCLFWLDFSLGLFGSAAALVVMLIKRFLSINKTDKETKINDN